MMPGGTFHAIGGLDVAMQLGEITSVLPQAAGVRIGWRAYGDRGEPAQLDIDLIDAIALHTELGRVLACLKTSRAAASRVAGAVDPPGGAGQLHHPDGVDTEFARRADVQFGSEPAYRCMPRLPETQ